MTTSDFKVHDYVYYGDGAVGRITDVSEGGNYRVDYCHRDFTSSGNGPVWAQGFPQKVTKPVDVLFVAAMQRLDRIQKMAKELRQMESDFESLKRAMVLLGMEG